MSRLRSFREAWGVFALALVVRLGVVAWAATRVPPTADGTYYQVIAERIAGGHGYTWLWPDGVVTYAAHYPVGYPALIGIAYAVLGAAPVVAMGLNALLGALAALAAHRVLASYGRVALVGGMLVALHPGLVAYTPAIMTEGVTASLLLLATWSAAVARRRAGARGVLPHVRLGRLAVVGLLLGVATLVRPQVIVLAPFLGIASATPRSRPRLAAALVVTAVALATCAPWTARNCTRMGRCAFVSVNGGWNLLIGTNPDARGGWAPVDVPAECRTVYDEAGKDHCFGVAARRRIAENPIGWASLAYGKLRATLDYCGAAGWYLHQANATAFSERAKVALGVAETLYERAMLAMAIAACLPRRRHSPGARHRIARALGFGAMAAALSPWGALAHLAAVVGLGVRAVRSRAEPLTVAAFATLASTAAIHAVFFGGGRYQLPVLGVLTAFAARATCSSASRTSASGSPTTLV